MNTRNIWCVGRNYKNHALELNNPIPETPLIFLKAGTCATTANTIQLPAWTDDIHHECELAIRVNADCQPLEMAIALDLTARQVQTQLKKKGEPWTLAKSFTGACPISSFIPFEGYEQFDLLHFKLSKNGHTVQHGSPKDMIFSLNTLLSSIRQHYPVAEGDIILTGTPEGVGPIKKGDVLKAEISDKLQASWTVI